MTEHKTEKRDRGFIPLYVKSTAGPFASCQICAALVAVSPEDLVRHHMFHGWSAAQVFSPSVAGMASARMDKP